MKVQAGGQTDPSASPEQLNAELASLLSGARALKRVLLEALDAREVGSPEHTCAADTAARLERSVVRPLKAACEQMTQRAGHAVASIFDETAVPAVAVIASAQHVGDWLGGEALWDLARRATRLRLAPALPNELQEATAALQDLACRFEPASAEDAAPGSARVAELEEIQAQLPTAIVSQTDGPYLVTNAASLVNWLGEELPRRPQMALCRCGASAIKPFCDGSHTEVDFKGAKDPERVPDRRDRYVGEQVTIFDNRGICQHSGFCSNRVASAFRVDREPFVAPSGGRMDELIRAVRDCPSGALSYAIDGREAREQVDYNGTREPAIEVSKDGPYRISGATRLADGEGNPEPRNDGASLEHYALCRCGHSQNKPFCSGMHWYVDFKDPLPDPDREPSVFEWAGGLPVLRRMTRLFYEKHVPEDPLLAPLFANMSADHPERVASWLGEVFGGPKSYSGQYGGYVRMISQHLGKEIDEEKRTRWVALLTRAAQEAGLPNDPEFRSVFNSYIEWGSRLAVENSTAGAHPPEYMPMPHWDWHTAAGAPGSRASALAPRTEEPADQPVVLPGPEEPVSFERHIRTLFRRRDRQSMEFAFDLWAYDEVRQNAPAILERLRNGSMPCDGAWPPEKLQAFTRWVDSGMSV
jgi:CDGSH-type Zn-finger protein/truncated hemoglobin YjbI